MRRPVIPDWMMDQAGMGDSLPQNDDPIMGDMLTLLMGGGEGAAGAAGGAGAALAATGMASKPLQRGAQYAYGRFPGMMRPSTERIDRAGGNFIQGEFKGQPNPEGMKLHPEDPSKWHKGNIAAYSPFGLNSQERYDMVKSQMKRDLEGEGYGRYLR